MSDKKDHISRRIFLKNSLVGLGALAVTPHFHIHQLTLNDWPQNELLGRNLVYSPNTLPIRSKPDPDASIVRTLINDEVVIWNEEVIGSSTLYSPSRRWVHTPEGYIYAPSIQPVKNSPNTPISDLPIFNGVRGFWAEVSIPYIGLELVNGQPLAPWLVESPRDLWKLYYSQVVWVDELRTNSQGVVQYRVSELYGSYGDVFWADAYAFRVITPEEIVPIHPEAANKRIVVNVNQQNLTCYEGNNEVYYCQVSTGKKFDVYGNPVDDLKTPKGEHWIWRKSISFHMSGGGTGAGWDTMGIGWTTLFVGTGVAIHSTFWHNDFGTPKSHGCVNVPAEDAKWIFRWTTPEVAYNPGDITDNTYQGTKIEVIEPLY